MTKCQQKWADITLNKWVINMVKGIRLELTAIPRQTHTPASDSRVNKEILRGKIEEMLMQGVIEPAKESKRSFVSHLFLREKKNGDFRPILNLSKLNESIVYRHFKMEQLQTVMQLIEQGAWMASVDISQAYHSLEVRQQDRDLLQFIYEKRRWRFRVLPNGLSSGPRIFTKIMKAVMSHLREVHGILLCFYIDDTIIIGETADEVSKGAKLTVMLLEKLGFTVNKEKSVIVPTRKLQFLGFNISTVDLTVTIPPDKCREIKASGEALLQAKRPTIRQLAAVVGKFVATDQGNRWARIRSKVLVRALNWNLRETQGDYRRELRLTRKARESIGRWIEDIEVTGKSYKRRPVDAYIYTDASLKGWGMYSQTHATQYGEEWDSEQTEGTHINVLELRAVHRMLLHLEGKLEEKHVRVFVDNTTAVACINKGGSARSKPCQEETERIVETCEKGRIMLTAKYCPGVLNTEADEASRIFTDSGEWELDSGIVTELFKELGKPEVDMFASRYNHVLPCYVAREFDKQAWATDALTMCWEGINAYFFPPFSCLSRVLRKLLSERPRGILIAPEWPTQPWYPLLRRLSGFRESRKIAVTRGTLRLRNKAGKGFPLCDRMELRAIRL